MRTSRAGPGPAEMRRWFVEIPDQLVAGFALGRKVADSVPPSVERILAVGMGGSAIAADLLSPILEDAGGPPLTVERSPQIPRRLGPRDLLVCVSYSGNTRETVGAFLNAARTSAVRIAVSSGGRLELEARQSGARHLRLPGGPPPRAAIGFLLGGLLGAVGHLVGEELDRRFRSAIAANRERLRSWNPPNAAPGRLARRVGSRIPHVVAEHRWSALARRWTTQLEENAKRLAYFDVVPELLHNAVVGWDALPSSRARSAVVIALEWPADEAGTRLRLEYLRRLARRRGARAERVVLEGSDRLDATIAGILWGDRFSLAVAELARVDPYPIVAIEAMKRSLERLEARRREREPS